MKMKSGIRHPLVTKRTPMLQQITGPATKLQTWRIVLFSCTPLAATLTCIEARLSSGESHDTIPLNHSPQTYMQHVCHHKAVGPGAVVAFGVAEDQIQVIRKSHGVLVVPNSLQHWFGDGDAELSHQSVLSKHGNLFMQTNPCRHHVHTWMQCASFHLPQTRMSPSGSEVECICFTCIDLARRRLLHIVKLALQTYSVSACIPDCVKHTLLDISFYL